MNIPSSLRLPLAIALLVPSLALAQTPTPAQQQLRAIYKELVEINTTDSTGSCTQAADAMRVHLKAGGIPDADLQLLVPPGGPKKGNLVARLRGSGAKKPMLLLAHLDVVEAKREDWARDPFTPVDTETGPLENGRPAKGDPDFAHAYQRHQTAFIQRVVGCPPWRADR